jgi:hypothetical protein
MGRQNCPIKGTHLSEIIVAAASGVSAHRDFRAGHIDPGNQQFDEFLTAMPDFRG